MMTFNPLAPVPVEIEDMDEAAFLAIMPRSCGTCSGATSLTGAVRVDNALYPSLCCTRAMPEDAQPVSHKGVLSGASCLLWRQSRTRALHSFTKYGPLTNKDLRIYASRIAREMAEAAKQGDEL